MQLTMMFSKTLFSLFAVLTTQVVDGHNNVSLAKCEKKAAKATTRGQCEAIHYPGRKWLDDIEKCQCCDDTLRSCDCQPEANALCGPTKSYNFFPIFQTECCKGMCTESVTAPGTTVAKAVAAQSGFDFTFTSNPGLTIDELETMEASSTSNPRGRRHLQKEDTPAGEYLPGPFLPVKYGRQKPYNEPCFDPNDTGGPCEGGYQVCCVKRNTCTHPKWSVETSISSNINYYEGGCWDRENTPKKFWTNDLCRAQGECVVPYLEEVLGGRVKNPNDVRELPEEVLNRLQTRESFCISS